MAVAKYISSLPEQEYSIGQFFFVNSNLINKHIEPLINGLTIPQVRQLTALEMVTIQRRKVYVGVCSWLRNSPSGGNNYKVRKALFYDNMAVLESLGYIQLIDVFNGRQVRLTEQGEYICKVVDDTLTAYYTRIFKQFNLVPKLPS